MHHTVESLSFMCINYSNNAKFIILLDTWCLDSVREIKIAHGFAPKTYPLLILFVFLLLLIATTLLSLFLFHSKSYYTYNLTVSNLIFWTKLSCFQRRIQIWFHFLAGVTKIRFPEIGKLDPTKIYLHFDHL